MGKNNKFLKEEKEGTKVESYSIKKFKVGAASVVIGASIFLGAGAVAQASEEVSNNTTTNNTTNAKEETSKPVAQPKVENTKESVASAVAAKVGAETPKVEAPETEVKQEVPVEAKLDKSTLEAYVKEVSANISAGKYANKTEASVAVLKADLESAKATLANAKTQAELNAAYNKLVTTVNSKLVNKPVEKKETPAVDTTQSKPTVGKKAENTEKKSDSNSIENTGSKDSRNGQALDKNNAFRAETTATHGNFNYSMEYSNGKEIYLYNEEDADVNITVSSTAGNITKATVKAGSGQFVLKSKSDQAIAYAKKQSSFNPPEEEVEIDGYGWSYHQTLSETQGPVKIKITGKPNDTFKGLKSYTKTEDQRAVLGARYLQLEDSTGAKLAGGNNPSAPGYFNLVVKSQTYKYDIQPVAEKNKVAVADINNLTPTDIDKIKEKINIQYSDKATKEDARLASKKGEVLQDRSTVVKEVAVANGTVTVMYNDDSVDTTPVANVARTNPAPTVELPYSNADKRQIYVYTGENTDLTFTGKDETTVKDLYLRGPGGVGNDNAAAYGFTTGKIDNGAVTNGEGTVSSDKRTATIKMTGITTLKAPNQWTSFIEAKDNDDFKSMTGANYDASTDDAVRKQKPGYVQFIVKSQTDKYNIKAPTEKVTVADPANVTEDDLAKIKEKLQLEYNKDNDDANISKDAPVTDKDAKIKSVTKDAKGNLVVTYADGSQDTRALSDFVNKAPTVELPYSNADKRQIYVYTGENTDLTFTGKDETTVKDLYLRGPGGIGNDNTAGYGFTTGKIDNDVVTNGEGTVSGDKRTATIKMTGVTTLTAPNKWTSFVVANDNDNAKSMPSDLNYDASTDDAVRKQKPGYVEFIVKDQTSKYDIVAPTEKVAVADPANVTDAELEKIKEKLKLEYNKDNDDANLADKKGKNVEDKDTKIKSITKDNQGNLVVTYKDGSVDKKPLSEFVNLNKQPALDAVNKAAENKIAEINKTPNATDEEKAAAIAKVNADKEKALNTINDANVTTKAELDKAKKAGTTAIAADNPVVAKKDAAKADVEAARKAKSDAINADKNLSQAEKDAAIAKINKAAEDATKAINAATTDAAVDTAKNAGTTEFGKVNPVAKAAAKQAVADELTKKEAEIDARDDLTQEEKDAAKKEAQAKAKEATDAINAQPDTVDTPEKATAAQQAVDAAKDKGVSEVKAINPEAKAKPAAKKAIDEALKAKEAEIDARTDLTDEEKTAAKEEAKAAADKAKENVDKATTDAAVKEAEKAGTSEVKAINPEAKAKPEAKKAIDEKLAEQLKAIENTPDTTDEEKAEAIQKAQDAAEQAKQAIDDAKTDAEVNTAKETGVAEVEKALPVVEDKPNARKAIDEEAKAKKAEIDARNDLSPKAKEALKAKVDKVANKAKAAIDAVSSEADVNVIGEADKEAIKAIGDINRPIDKVLVKDPSALTDEEKAKILEEVKKVNPTAKEVKYNENGKIEVTTENGDKGTINPAKLVKTEEDLDNGKGGNDINKPLDKVIVKDPANLTDEEKAKIIAGVEEVNPDAIVTIDENGTVSVSTPDGKTSAIPASDLVRTKEDTEKAGAGNSSIVKPADKIVGEANDPDDQAKAEEKLRELNPDTKSVKFDGNGNVTVTLKDGTTATIPSEDLFKSETDETKPNAGNDVVKPADKAVVANPEQLTDAEKKAIEDKVKAVNPDATVVVDNKGNTLVTTAEGKTAVIQAADLTKSAEDAAKPKAGNDIVKPADKTVVANPEQLTDAEKKAIEDKVKAVNPGATVAVDDKGNATVTTPEGKTAVIPATDLVKTPEDAAKPNAGNDIVKPADKTAVANKDALTPEEKKAIEDKVKAVNPGATVAVDDKGNATVTTPEGKTAVIPATDLVKIPEDAAKPKAGNDIVKPADKTVAANPEKLTDAEKKVIEDKVKAVNPGATVVVDDKGNATVTTPEGKTAVIPATDLVKTPEDAAKPNAGNDIVKPADKTAVANKDALTPEEKKAIEDKVKAVNPGATVAVDDKGNATVTTPEGKTAVIPATDLVKTPEDAAKPKAGNDIVKPADKTVAANPEQLTDAERKAIEDKVKAVNPDATVVVDNKGNTLVTTPEGKTAVIPGKDLVKSQEDAAKPKAGNDIVKPADKTVVANKDVLTPEEKKAIAAKVKEVNPEATVVVDDKGNATVTTPEGKTAVIPGKDLVKTEADAAKPNAGNDVAKPADKTAVANKDALTPEEKKAIEDKVKAVNPGATVAVDDKGNATVTTPEGKTAVIPATDLVKTPEDAAKPKAGNDIVKPADKTVAANPEQLTDAERKAIEDKVKAVNPGATVVVDDKGNATVTTPEGKTAVIPGKDLVKTPEDATKPKAGNDIVKPAEKTAVANKDALTPEEKKAIEDKVKAVNPGATVAVDDKGNATVTTPEGKTAVIPATDLVKTPEDAAKPKAGNDIVKPADKTVAANLEKLTDAEKKAIEDKVKAVNPDATVAVDDKGNATVTTPEGKTAVIPGKDLVKTAEDATKPKAGNDIVKPADKTVAANPEKLTDAEKKAIAAKVKGVNLDSTVVVDDKGNATVTTPEGKTAVIPGKDLVKTAEDATKPKAGNDIVKPADKTVAANPEKLTDAEKKAIEDKVKAVNPGATVAVDDKGNATVTTPEGKTAVIPGNDLVKSQEDATKPKAGNDVAKPADKTLVKDPAKLTDEEKAKIAAKVKEVNPGATVVVDDKGNATVTTPEGKTAVIPGNDLVKSQEDAAKPKAGNDVAKPADKTLVKDPAKLTDEEKAAIAAKVKEVNPDSTVVVDDKGNATVTTPEGKTAVIPGNDLVKIEADLGRENAGNNVNTPTARTAVANKDALTDAEKEAVMKAVEAVNPGATVVVDDKGNATVTTKDGKVAVIPASKLVILADKVTDTDAQSGINTPAARTLVANKDSLTPEEIAKIKASVEAVNPGAIVVVDAKGNATVTTKDGVTATIAAEQLVKDAKDVAAKNNGENINLDFEKQTVADLGNLTDADKAGAKDKIKAANPNVAEVVFDAKGNVTVILKDGSSFTILAKDIFNKAEEQTSPMINIPEKVQVGDSMNLTDEEKEAVKQALIKANPVLKEAKVTISATGEAIIVYPDGRELVIPAEKLVVAKGSNNQSNDNNGTSNKEDSSNVSRENHGASIDNAQKINTKLGQALANTGTTETNTGLAGLGMAILGGLLAARRRKNDKR